MVGHPNWEHLKTFWAAMEGGSLSGAARLLGSTQPTVGRQIESLEAELSLKLFSRSREGLQPTKEAYELLEGVRSMVGASQSLMRSSSGVGEEASGSVRVAASEVVGTEILPELLAQLGQAFPKIAIELVLSNQTEDLLKRDADIAIRMFRPEQKALVAKKIGETPVGLYAHRDYLKKRSLPRTWDDLRTHRLIGPDRDTLILKNLAKMGNPVPSSLFLIRTDNQTAQLQMVRAGAGIGGVQNLIANRDPNLIRVVPELLNWPLEVWMVMHEELMNVRRIRAVYDFLSEKISKLLSTLN